MYQGRQGDEMDCWSHSNETIGCIRRQLANRLVLFFSVPLKPSSGALQIKIFIYFLFGFVSVYAIMGVGLVVLLGGSALL